MQQLPIHESAESMQSLVAAAHELKTPLTIITHLAAALEDETMPLTPADRQASLRRIQLSAERTLRLIQGLTTSYHLDGQLALGLHLEPVNINQICEEVAHEMMPFAAMQRQKVHLHIGRKAQLVVGDRELLHSILFNLLDNAMRHTPPETIVAVHVRRRTETVRVCVHDDGPGLQPSDLTKLQQRLGRQSQPIVTRSSGSGLGLYIAQQIAQAMGGRIGVGRVKTGADFHLDLLYSRQLSLV